MPRLAAPEPFAANSLPVPKPRLIETNTTSPPCNTQRAAAAPLTPTGSDACGPRGDNGASPPQAASTHDSASSEIASPKVTSGAPATENFRPLSDVTRGISSAAWSSLVLAALVITVRTARHGLAVLLSAGICGADLFGAVHARGSRDAMHKRVETQASDFLGTRASAFLASEETWSGSTLRCYACPLEQDAFDSFALDATLVTSQEELREAGRMKDNQTHAAVLAPVTALHDFEYKRHCLLAAAAVDTMRAHELTSEAAFTREYANQSGDAVRLSGSGNTASGGPASEGWALRSRLHEASQDLVQLQLRDAARKLALKGSPEDAEELIASAERVGNNKVTPLSSIPFELRGPDTAVADIAWRHARFSPVLEAPVTDALPTPRPQHEVTWRPATIEDLFMPGVWAKVAAWCEGNAKDLLWMREHGDGGKRPHKQQPLFLAQSDMVPEARGVVWDLRRASDGIIEPWDFTAPATSGLNLPFLEVLLPTCPDRELVSHLRHGAVFKADLPL